MNLFIHNLKVALRNLMNYKLQTLMSVASIAIGIVTLSLTHSVLNNFRPPLICNQPYFDRTYNVTFTTDNPQKKARGWDIMVHEIDNELLHTLKGNGGLIHAERIVIPKGFAIRAVREIQLSDSSVFNGQFGAVPVDPEYPEFAGVSSSTTGQKIRKLKAGEAIISRVLAKQLFKDKNPIGGVFKISSYNAMNTRPLTIVDMFEPLPEHGNFIDNRTICYAPEDNIEDMDMSDMYSAMVMVVLREGSTEAQLRDEIMERVKPLDITSVELSKAVEQSDINVLIGVRLLAYLIGSLILLAAIIGFLRIQIQLFWIRKREISLRVVNGATKLRLFTLMLTEISITIILSMILALWLGVRVEHFIATKLITIIPDLYIDALWQFTLLIGVALIAICGLIAWITLRRICKSGQGLAANMRRSRSHLFRNVMLGVQTTICLVFVCVTFVLIKGVNQLITQYNLPPNDSYYKQFLFFIPCYAKQPEMLLDEIKRLPELESILMWDRAYYSFDEIQQNPEAKDKLNGRTDYEAYLTTDTAALSLLGVEVEWLNRDIDRNRSILLTEDLYKTFSEAGILDKNALTIYGGIANHTLPVAGVIKNIPYNTNHTGSLIAINPDWPAARTDYVLFPKKGDGAGLAESVSEVIARLEPFTINPMIDNYREKAGPSAVLVESFRTGGWILGIVSLIICAMSIYSTIALDTRARKKEVAIRKVNGAKSKNIYAMFGKVYIVIMAIAILIATPVAVLFTKAVAGIITESTPGVTFSGTAPIILGILTVSALVTLIVGWQTYRVMRLDPSKIIAKE